LSAVFGKATKEWANLIGEMDLINTVNQLLLEMNKLKSEKTSLEEELKMHSHTLACYHIKGTVTAP
jgi:hypothetical protein